jgi:predicted MPP superfamily phosphohydrolase
MLSPPTAGSFTVRSRPLLTRRRFLLGSAASVCGAVAYTGLVEPFWVEHVSQTLPIPSLPSGLRGARLVQLSDVHVSSRVSEDYLRRSFARVTALEPDIVVYTGDFITHEGDTHERLSRLLPHFPRGRLGTLGVLGNHDYGSDWRDVACAATIVQQTATAGIRILRNEAASINGLSIVGLDELWAKRSDPAAALAPITRASPTLVLSHNPDSADQGNWRSYAGWILCGHTHGGQCKPPFLPPPLLPVRNRRYTAGKIPLKDGRTLYINRGLGYLHQVRFNARPEVTVFTLA